MQTVTISGGTGLVGSALSSLLLEKGYKVIILTRHPSAHQATEANITYAKWDIQDQQMDEAAVKNADYIIHLAGANVAGKRWTDDRKQEIIDSRVGSSHLLYKKLKQVPNRVKAFISASAIGYYGQGEEPSFKENDAPADDFLGKTCVAWENSVKPIADLGKRLMILRTGIVLSRKGGALKEMTKPLKFGIAGILGNGEQWMSWIHIQDLCRMYLNAITDEKLNGAYNAVAPHPLTQKQLILAIAREDKGKNFIPMPVPAFLLKLIMGEMSEEILKSTKVSSEKIRHTGFQFSYSTIDKAISAL